MRKIISLLLVLVLCVFAFCGCGENSKDGKGNSNTAKVDDSSQYTYKITPLQGVSRCIYYGPDDEVPNCSDQEAARNKIHVWHICPTCGGDVDTFSYKIDVKDLDFSSGDTITFTDSSICEDCRTNRNIQSYMWAISITRKKTEK